MVRSGCRGLGDGANCHQPYTLRPGSHLLSVNVKKNSSMSGA